MNNQYENEQKNFNNNNDMKENKKPKEEKVPLYMQLITVFKGYRNYGELERLSAGNAVKYFFYMTFIAALISIVVPIAGKLGSVGGVKNGISKLVPDFSFSGGKLELEEPVNYSYGGYQIVIDTSYDSFSKSDIDKTATYQILVSSTNALIYSSGQLTTYNFSYFKQYSLSKKALLGLVWLVYVFIVAYMIFAYISLMFEYFMLALILAIFPLFLMSKYHTPRKVTFGMCLKLAIFSITIPCIIESLNTCFGLLPEVLVQFVAVLWSSWNFYKAVILVSGFKPLDMDDMNN